MKEFKFNNVGSFGSSSAIEVHHPPNGSIKFLPSAIAAPILEIRDDGDILVKGKKIKNDLEVYTALKEFLKL